MQYKSLCLQVDLDHPKANLRDQCSHCSSNRSLAPTTWNVLIDAPRRLSGIHFLRLSSEATHCLYSYLG